MKTIFFSTLVLLASCSKFTDDIHSSKVLALPQVVIEALEAECGKNASYWQLWNEYQHNKEGYDSLTNQQ